MALTFIALSLLLNAGCLFILLLLCLKADFFTRDVKGEVADDDDNRARKADISAE